MKKLNEDDWVVTEAKISVKQATGTGLINKEYLFLVLFFAEYWRPLSEEEKRTGKYPGNPLGYAFDDFTTVFKDPHVGSNKETKKEKKKNLPEKIIDKELVSDNKKVTKIIFDKYQESDKVLVRYNRNDHSNFKIIYKDDDSSELDLIEHLID